MIGKSFQKDLKKEGNIEDFYLIDDDILGEGGNAIVKKGIKTETGEAFAIKIMAKQTMGENEKENLYFELKIMGIVDHPNIVRVYEYYESDDFIYIVMELMSGGELFDRIADVDHYTEKQATEAFLPIVDAVRYCHSLGIVHRDLKPENLLYTSKDEDATLKVSDFGFAKFIIPKVDEKLFTACGTPSYVAPEIISECGYDYKVDCWSLGVILYVMLCGFPPFYSDNNDELFDMIRNCKYEFLSPEWDTISDGAKDLVKKLLVRDPKKRLSTEQILEHPWLKQSSHSNEILPFKKDYLKYKECRNNFKKVFQASMLLNFWKKNLVKK